MAMECLLAPDEWLYFLHIPKTAGGTLTLFLDACFHEEEIFPARQLSELVRVVDLQDRLARCRFLRGHFDALSLDLLDPDRSYIASS
jgi:hypothetical protein